ncbi:mitofusin-1-like isoform X2 [Sebastes fasciatus]|uniref:mitofusin-1-like isoform X2 n=1 Tax=Sebastes fasciatus TaxID=394691 RepID=UPI003D9F695A
MNTEKLFFHKVSERISKPNIFILHNRWDASVSEPEYIDEVRKQHMDRCVSFLAEELKVVGLDEAPGRIFFVSAKEVLNSRMQRAQGMPETGGALAEGFHERLREFQMFERTFEEFISQSAVKTKFEQHTVRAWQITEAIKAVMDAINIASADRKIFCLEEREDQRDRLDFVRGQINRLTDNVRLRIRTLTDEVAAKVATALSDQIRSLPVLVEEFRADFNPTQENLELYKTKLLQHVDERMVGSLSHRCSVSVLGDIRDAQKHMIDSVRPLLSPSVHEQLSSPSASFDLTYELGLVALCADFNENIEFQFSLGWTALVTRFIGATNAKRALSGADSRLQESSSFKDEMVVSIATGLVSVTSRASMTVLVIGGVRARSEAAVCGARRPPPESRHPRHQLRLQPAGVQGAVVHLQPSDSESGSERGRAGGEHPPAELQDPETGEHPEEVQGLQEQSHGAGDSAGGLLSSVPAGELN